MSWLITGGAGYIGSHVVRAFRCAGLDVVVLDNLSTGYRDFVPTDVSFVEASVTDGDAVRATMDAHAVHGVVHLAALKYAGVSVQEPLRFYRENVLGMQVLLESVVDRGIDRLLLSSSASWYGTPAAEIVDEDEPPRPESPYGESKTISEWLLRDLARIRPELRQTSLRYFNVVGSGTPELADHSPHNLFPKVLRALTDGATPVVNGADYPTPDGSCVRDYVHVVDVADAHLAIAQRLDGGQRCAAVYNVGRGVGSSVFEILDSMRRITGIEFTPEIKARRPGDPARIVGRVERIGRDLDWHASAGLDEMVASAWSAWQHHLASTRGAS
ncbi:MAG: UDP-glucose 4-epimerase GalE [Actinobacteria bacterium]|nr:UDP-glucose 4-epimerase GalE [Actinomycetota bacterium]